MRERHLGRDEISHGGDEDDVGCRGGLADLEETRGDLGAEDVDGEKVGLAELEHRVGRVDEGSELG